MICVCGHDVTVHAKVYDGVLYQEGWFSADGEGRFLGRSARPFTLSGECRAVTDMGNHRLSCPCPRFVRALVPGQTGGYVSAAPPEKAPFDWSKVITPEAIAYADVNREQEPAGLERETCGWNEAWDKVDSIIGEFGDDPKQALAILEEYSGLAQHGQRR